MVVDGKWRIIRRIATGGMSTVYEAVHRTTRFRGAMKILNHDAADRPEVRERFDREGSTSNAVGHEGAVQVIDDGITQDGCPYLVMEYLEGETLEDKRVRCGGCLTVREVVHVGLAVADVLAAAHANGIVHRDVKPPNIFLTKTGDVKVLDFGVAGRRVRGEDTSLTGLGCGTPRFMAPEQLTGAHTIDARADVFALATTMYRALAGIFPFEASTIAEFLANASSREPRRLDDIVPELPCALADVIARALSPHPEKRYADAGEMAKAIRESMEEKPWRVSTTLPLEQPAPSERTLAMPSSVPPPRPSYPMMPMPIPRHAVATVRTRRRASMLPQIAAAVIAVVTLVAFAGFVGWPTLRSAATMARQSM
jgi:serine/threonine protein kinase